MYAECRESLRSNRCFNEADPGYDTHPNPDVKKQLLDFRKQVSEKRW